MSYAIIYHLESLILWHIEHWRVGRHIMHSQLSWGQYLRARAYLMGRILLLVIAHSYIISVLVLLLLNDTLKNSMPRWCCNRHISIFLKFGVVTLCFLGNTVSKEPAREALIVIFYGKYFIKTTKVIELVDTTLVNLPCELFAPHLIPKECWLLMHFFELTITGYPVEVLLSVSLSDA